MNDSSFQTDFPAPPSPLDHSNYLYLSDAGWAVVGRIIFGEATVQMLRHDQDAINEHVCPFVIYDADLVEEVPTKVTNSSSSKPATMEHMVHRISRSPSTPPTPVVQVKMSLSPRGQVAPKLLKIAVKVFFGKQVDNLKFWFHHGSGYGLGGSAGSRGTAEGRI